MFAGMGYGMHGAYNNKEIKMLAKSMMVLAAGALMLGAVSAQASDRDPAEIGGSKIGPLGQCFAPPNCGEDYRYWRGFNGFAYVPGRYRPSREWRY